MANRVKLCEVPFVLHISPGLPVQWLSYGQKLVLLLDGGGGGGGNLLTSSTVNWL